MKVAVVLQQMQSYRERERESLKGVSAFWLLLHFLCCLVSTVLGFRFSRLLFFLFFSTSATSPLLFFPSSASITTTTTTTITTITTTISSSSTISPSPPLSHITSNSTLPSSSLNATATATASSRSRSAFSQPVTTRPVVGRHGIRVRPWPHPDPLELMRAHHILRQVQLQQRNIFSSSATPPRPLLLLTPTFRRPAQALHLTALAHTLRLVPYPLTWVVIEAGGITNDTASILARSRVPFVHVPFAQSMPHDWEPRRLLEAKMRLHALRLITQQKTDSIIIFADESNIHDLKLFDEAQKVKSIGTIRLTFLTDPRTLDQQNYQQAKPLVQAPVCNSQGHLSGWRMLDPENNAFAPHKMEWAGFVLHSKWLLKKNLDDIDESLNGLLSDNGSEIEPLGNCGEKVLVWWIRAETQPDTKFPPGWVIENGILSNSKTNSTAKRR